MIETKRLRLRPWKESDLEPFAKMNADPMVREFFASKLDKEESDHLARTLIQFIDERGWGFWAVERLEDSLFIGFIGLEYVDFESHFTPAVEIGWRLSVEHWGKGYATEGANACLEYGFNTLHLPEIVALTAQGNVKSRRVMEKLGMTYDPKDDFDHPKIIQGHPVRRHVLYRKVREQWVCK